MQEEIVLNSQYTYLFHSNRRPSLHATKRIARLQRTTPYLGPNLQQILRKSYLKVLCKSAAGP